VVIAAESAKIGDGHLKYGVLPGGGGSIRLSRKLPHNIAKELLLTAKLVPASTLAHWGLVNHVVSNQELMPFTMEIAREIASLSPLGLREVKRLSNLATQVPLNHGLKTELEAFYGYVRSHDFSEGTKAFAEKRKPEFLGN
jgi:enoyl-CoA hydratase